MPHFHNNAAVSIEPPFQPDASYLFKAFEQSEDDLFLSRLNQKLAAQCGAAFRLELHVGDQLNEIPEGVLNSLAECYSQVFNESWGEDWTLESALNEVRKCIHCHEDYLPIMTLLFHEGSVVGFSWGFIIESENIHEENAPFSSSGLKRHESVQVSKYWLNEVAKINRMISIRELGVLKKFRHDKTPYLCLPLFEKAKSLKCNVAFLRTKVTSKAFTWSLGVGFVPLQLFMVDGLLLMHGSVKYASEILSGLLESGSKRLSQKKIMTNIKRYLCQY